MEGLSQQEIADKISVSRPTVSNLLRRCKEEGIVEIRIRETNSLPYVLQEELKAIFGLRDVRVVPSSPDESRTLESTGKAAAELLARSLRDGLKIGISWGSTTYKMISELNVAPKYQGIEVTQLLGSLGSINPIYDSYDLVRTLAIKLNGSYATIQAPRGGALHGGQGVFLKEPGIAAAIEKARGVDTAILSVSPDDPGYSSLVREGFITPEESAEISLRGAVGHSCGIHFDVRRQGSGDPLERPDRRHRRRGPQADTGGDPGGLRHRQGQRDPGRPPRRDSSTSWPPTRPRPSRSSRKPKKDGARPKGGARLRTRSGPARSAPCPEDPLLQSPCPRSSHDEQGPPGKGSSPMSSAESPRVAELMYRSSRPGPPKPMHVAVAKGMGYVRSTFPSGVYRTILHPPHRAFQRNPRRRR
ncbi:MAG: winged helix-turn-helix transcriptional regulator [Candidatus Moduliflexus flocculans]|nr:winged helix-turn-helix transcriptional regulator [Candidatus Moduliflexus flocculans]